MTDVMFVIGSFIVLGVIAVAVTLLIRELWDKSTEESEESDWDRHVDEALNLLDTKTEMRES